MVRDDSSTVLFGLFFFVDEEVFRDFLFLFPRPCRFGAILYVEPSFWSTSFVIGQFRRINVVIWKYLILLNTGEITKKFENTKVVIGIRKPKRTDNTMAKRKSTNNDLQNITQKTKDRAVGTTLKTGMKSGAPERPVSSFWSTCNLVEISIPKKFSLCIYIKFLRNPNLNEISPHVPPVVLLLLQIRW
jgi:hypothetical protein